MLTQLYFVFSCVHTLALLVGVALVVALAMVICAYFGDSGDSKKEAAFYIPKILLMLLVDIAVFLFVPDGPVMQLIIEGH